jgi:vacuolar-type H+-ATPase subunit D/Vma8
MPDTSPTIEGSAGMSTKENQKQLHLQATRRALDQTKETIKRSMDDTTSEISRYIQAINDYQENTFQETKEFIDSYLEIQNETIISFQSAWDPYLRTNDDGLNYYYYWVAPKWMAQVYAETIRTLTDNMTTAVKLVNNIYESIVPSRRSKQQIIENTTK